MCNTVMKRELLKKLKEHGWNRRRFNLESVISDCGEKFSFLDRSLDDGENKNLWIASGIDEMTMGSGRTPLQAVVELWINLKKNNGKNKN